MYYKNPKKAERRAIISFICSLPVWILISMIPKELDPERMFRLFFSVLFMSYWVADIWAGIVANSLHNYYNGHSESYHDNDDI